LLEDFSVSNEETLRTAAWLRLALVMALIGIAIALALTG
jgi:hypothetical protein